VRYSILAGLGCSALFIVAACQIDKVAAPSTRGAAAVPVSPPFAEANTDCHYTPDGEFVSIPAGTLQNFVADDADDCTNAYLEVIFLPAHSGALGFGATCAIKTFTVSSFFKIKKCTTGPSRINIYTNSSKTTLIQTIGVDLL